MRLMRLILAVVFAAVSRAQMPVRPASITAVGTAMVSVVPDLARVDVSVFTQGATAQDASTANATQASTIIAALQALLGANANIKTINYSLSPVYNNPPRGQNAIIIGLSISEIRWSGAFEVRQAMYLGRSAAGIGANPLAVAGCQVSDRT